jgi:regulatory protein
MSPRTPVLDEEHAMDYALRVLGYRPRSETELRRRLERKGYSAQVTDRTLATCMRLGLLDDREFARGWVTAHPDRGPARLRQDLTIKGINRSLAEEIVQAEMSREDEETAAWEVARRAVRTRPLPLDREELLRVRRLLQRRGFAFEVVGRVCARLNDQLTAEGEWLE